MRRHLLVLYLFGLEFGKKSVERRTFRSLPLEAAAVSTGAAVRRFAELPLTLFDGLDSAPETISTAVSHHVWQPAPSELVSSFEVLFDLAGSGTDRVGHFRTPPFCAFSLHTPLRRDGMSTSRCSLSYERVVAIGGARLIHLMSIGPGPPR